MKKLFIFGMSCFIIFFILGTLVWLFIEQKGQPITKLDRAFDDTQIEALVVNTDIVNVKFQEGKTFHMQYKGREQLNVTQQGRTVQVVERMNGKRKMLNLNPFITNAEELVVTLPPNHLKHLNVTTHIANVNMKDVKVDKVMVWNDQNGEVNLKDCQFKHTQIKGHETFVKVENSKLAKSDVNVANGMIFANHTAVEQSLFKLGEGDMHLLKMSPECDLKGIANQGDIEMSYAQAPKHVRLKLQPTNGEAMVEHPNIKNGINGNGKHQIELYTNDGNIVVR